MRTEPRISVSKLGEYLRATPRRRRSIVVHQKRPSDYVVIWYKEAREAVVECLLTGGDLDRLREARLLLEDDLSLLPEESPQARRITVSLSAIDAFSCSMLEHAMTHLDVARPGRVDRKLSVGGVSISVRPDLLVRTKKGVGAICCNRPTRDVVRVGAVS